MIYDKYIHLYIHRIYIHIYIHTDYSIIRSSLYYLLLSMSLFSFSVSLPATTTTLQPPLPPSPTTLKIKSTMPNNQIYLTYLFFYSIKKKILHMYSVVYTCIQRESMRGGWWSPANDLEVWNKVMRGWWWMANGKKDLNYLRV